MLEPLICDKVVLQVKNWQKSVTSLIARLAGFQSGAGNCEVLPEENVLNSIQRIPAEKTATEVQLMVCSLGVNDLK